MRGASSLFAALALCLTGACSSPEREAQVPPSPALWEVRSPDGEIEGWLFGTIHSLPKDMDWRSRELDRAISLSDMLVVEASDAYDTDTIQTVMMRTGVDANLPPLSERIAPADRDLLSTGLAELDIEPGSLDKFETWAAALAVGARSGTGNSGPGSDQALVEDFSDRPVAELEGAERQLAIFDHLPEAEQRDLLSAVLKEAERHEEDPQRLARLWRAGDIDEIEREGAKGLLGDPELRAALLVERNLDWAGQLTEIFGGEPTVLVAVGAAHLAGPDGLPTLLENRGYRVSRIQ